MLRRVAYVQDLEDLNGMEQRDIDLGRRAEIGRERRSRTRANIIAAAFELFGREDGLYSRIEDIAAKANVTRATFYNHFSGMAELREALTHELTHDFLNDVSFAISRLKDPREKASVAFRFYLHRARTDRNWAWSIINVSANGIFFGAETQRHAEQTIREGINKGVLDFTESSLGTDLVLGTAVASIATMLRREMPDDYPETAAEHVLRGLGVSPTKARAIARVPLPILATIQT